MRVRELPGMDAIQIRDLRIGDAVLDGDDELLVTGLELGERVARVRFAWQGLRFQREHRPRDLVLRTPREDLLLRAAS